MWAENEPVDAGDGYYTISNAAQLRRLSELSNDPATRATWNKRNFKLAADIDLENINFTPLFLMEQSVGSSDKAGKVSLDFRGIFDGQGHTIKNLSITMDESSTYQVGLFSRVFTGTLKNLMLKDVRIKTQNATTEVAIGGVVGRDGSATIENCGVINISFDLAIVGSGSTSTGAVAGYLSDSNSSIIKNCYSNNATYSSCGGKGAKAIETECFNGADVSAKLATGELCYLLNGSSSENPVWFQTLDTDLYPVPDSSHEPVFYNGPFACDGVTPSGGDLIFGNTDAPIISGHAAYEEWLCPNCGALDPAFTMTPVAGIYEIDIPAELKWFAAYVNEEAAAANAKLTADIDMAGKYWTPMTAFAGTFDGDNHTISNLGAPFCMTTAGGTTIKNLTLSGSLTSTQDRFGAFICDHTKGTLTISNCVNATTITTTSYTRVGGFVGNIAGGTVNITDCVNTANLSINSTNNMGGIIGDTSAGTNTLTRCFNRGNIAGGGENAYQLGGLVGTFRSAAGSSINFIKCGNEGDVSGLRASVTVVRAGGLLGWIRQGDSGNNKTISISECYNTGNITTTRGSELAGLVASPNPYVDITIANSYNAGTVTANVTEDDNVAPKAAMLSNTNTGGSLTLTNCYTKGTQESAITVTDEQFASGEVTYKLNGGNIATPVWKQAIGTDERPMLTGSNIVYRTYMSGENSAYSNTSGATIASMILTDMADYAADADFKAESLTYNRTLAAGGYHSLCLPFAINNTGVFSEKGGKLFTLKEKDENYVTLEETKSVDAGVPCFASVTSEYTFPVMSNVEMVASVNNSGAIKGTFTEITGAGAVGVYKLDSNGEYFAKTVAVGGEITDAPVIKPFRSYIAGGASSVKTLNILLSDGTSLTPTLSEEREAVIYDLAGRRVEKATKGIYIVNGKKVVK